MKRIDLEHIIRAAANSTGATTFIIVGSQAILGAFPNASAPLLASRDADIYAPGRPDLRDEISGALGELSDFDKTFGYHADGVGPETAKLPTGWEDRLIRIENRNTHPGVGMCLEPHDIAASKLAAWREKDHSFVRTLLAQRMISAKTLMDRVATMDLPDDRIEMIILWLRANGNP